MEPLTMEQAEDLGARILHALDNGYVHSCLDCPDVLDYMREQVASDLAGLRELDLVKMQDWSPSCYLWLRETFTASLRRAAKLYDVVVIPASAYAACVREDPHDAHDWIEPTSAIDYDQYWCVGKGI